MNDWILSLAGTEAGHRVALGLALAAAVLHALFGALQKGRHDPWLSRAAIDICYGAIALPFALFVVPWPEPHMWPIFAGAFVIHAAYKWLQAMTFSRGAYTVVYPVVRGTAPLFTVLGAGLFAMMTTWHRGRELLFARFRQDGLPLKSFIARLPQRLPPRIERGEEIVAAGSG